MKIYGPYLRKDNRKHIVIVHADGRKQTKSYPKYLLEQKIGRELKNNETCDHIDEDFTNDDPNNLKILTRPDNASKAWDGYIIPMYKFNCPECGLEAERTVSAVKHNRKNGKAGPFCSRSCAGKYSRKRCLAPPSLQELFPAC